MINPRFDCKMEKMKKEVKNNVNIHKTENKQDIKINRLYQKSVRMCWKVDCRTKQTLNTRPPDVNKNINFQQKK